MVEVAVLPPAVGVEFIKIVWRALGTDRVLGLAWTFVAADLRGIPVLTDVIYVFFPRGAVIRIKTSGFQNRAVRLDEDHSGTLGRVGAFGIVRATDEDQRSIAKHVRIRLPVCSIVPVKPERGGIRYYDFESDGLRVRIPGLAKGGRDHRNAQSD